MPAPAFAPATTLLSALGRLPPPPPWRVLLRSAVRRFNPPRLETLSSAPGPAVRAAIARGDGPPEALATVRRHARHGPRPTLVLGGFVPGAVEQVYLLRGFLARHGSVYYLDYPRDAFPAPLLAAQLDDLAAEIAAREGAPPVVVAVSFGAGVVLDWLRRTRLAGRPAPELAGLLLVSPVCCLEDLASPDDARDATLLGRAIRPLLEVRPDHADASGRAVEKARALFARMFEAGAQNREALAALLTRSELTELRGAVRSTIAGITPAGALARVRALRDMACPASYHTPELLPLHPAPTLVLYAEKEGSVLRDASPARAIFERACRTFFPRGETRTVRNSRGGAVQHASLLFHVANFLPVFTGFYRRLKHRKALEIA